MRKKLLHACVSMMLLGFPLSPPVMGQIFLEDVEAIPLSEVDPRLFRTWSVVYDNTDGPYWITSVTPRWHLLDDGSFPPGFSPLILERVGYAIRVFETAPLYIRKGFWSLLNPDGPICNADNIGTSIGNLSHLAPGDWFLSHSTIGWEWYFPYDQWAVEFEFLISLSPDNPSPNATVLFASGGPSIGSNDGSVFWLDANENGFFECPAEAQEPELSEQAQFYLFLRAQEGVQSELQTWGLLKALYR